MARLSKQLENEGSYCIITHSYVLREPHHVKRLALIEEK